MENWIRLDIPLELEGARLDAVLNMLVEEMPSRSFAARLIDSEFVKVNQKVCKSSHKIKKDDEICIDLSAILNRPVHIVPQPENIQLDIFFEDQDIMVINKPPGLVVHPGAGHFSGTLVNAILQHCGTSLPSLGGADRAGIVHRLDKDTSGVMVIAKTQKALSHLSTQFSKHEQKRLYFALVFRAPKVTQGTVSTWHGRDPQNPIKYAVLKSHQGKTAVTHFEVKKNLYHHKFSLIECQLFTGRTHQIRVHMSYLGCPIVGDMLYTFPFSSFGLKQTVVNFIKKIPRQCLHAHTLGFVHPCTGQYMEFFAPLPDDFATALQNLQDFSEDS